MPRSLLSLPIALGLLAPGAASGEPVDWAGLADVGTVEVVTADADGEARETTVWLVVVDGAGYVRTGSTTWGGNVVRRPELVLRVGERSLPMRVEFVEDAAARQRVSDAFREKYGFEDWVLAWVRGARPKIMHLQPTE